MAKPQEAVKRRNQKVGIVVSTKTAKTIVVEVKRQVAHPLYRRYITRRKKFHAHDEKGLAQVGDKVRIVECRPISKLKHWRLADIIWKPERAEPIEEKAESETKGKEKKKQ